MSIKRYTVRLSKPLRWLAPAAAALFVFAVVFTAGSFSRNYREQDPRPSENASRGSDKTALVETELITITTRGVEPAEISRPAGRFILMVDNRSGEEMQFRIARETGESLHDIRSSREERDWSELMDLKPGKYVLTERDRPDLTCSITITAR
jgi:hypothetical protein